MLHWTGHPFVDAGLAAIMAVVGVERPEDITATHLEEAKAELERILLSDQSLGIGVEKSFASGALSQLFPNSELVNPANRKQGIDGARQKFSEALRQDLEKAILCLTQEGEAFCSICGRRVPEEALLLVRKDRMPLLSGIVNFYPAFTYGAQVCGLCAFVVRFLPMSVLRTGVSGRLWFLHTQAPGVASRISRRYGWAEMHKAIAANEPLDFYGRWRTAGDEGTVLYVLCELLEALGKELQEIYRSPLPTVAYIFSNDNKKPYITPLLIPNEILRFLATLYVTSFQAFHTFWRDLLVVPEGLEKREQASRLQFVRYVARRLLSCESIAYECLDHGDAERTPRLRGGWLGHALYLREVRKVPEGKLAILERLGMDIARSEEAKKHIVELRTAEDSGRIRALFLHYVRRGWLRHDEFYTLLPPNDAPSAKEVRDILLAVVYAWQHCQAQGEEFQSIGKGERFTPDAVLARITQVGEKLLAGLPNPSRWIGQLQVAWSSERIRGVYLSAVQRGALSFADFVFLAPFGDRRTLWLLRDYLLAFLFEKARDAVPEEDIAVSEEAASYESLQ